MQLTEESPKLKLLFAQLVSRSKQLMVTLMLSGMHLVMTSRVSTVLLKVLFKRSLTMLTISKNGAVTNQPT